MKLIKILLPLAEVALALPKITQLCSQNTGIDQQVPKIALILGRSSGIPHVFEQPPTSQKGCLSL